ncbi:DUF2203 domain-containing protein [Cohnella candidum]|uniref:DUF2203 family protein n=1 Tax=Cohnella candidum TaxID=2674991 RepID=A0A3G3JXI6_9BACL|nr:DUF2203 domain-containing protein [Cohnella candidum]AYQ72960.1 DUF2203 family protein [Cohnella candidum]
MDKKIFTLEEANALLPELKADLLELQRLSSRFEELYEELREKKARRAASAVQTAEAGDPYFEEEIRLDFMKMEVDLLIGNFERKGVLLKMIRPGLIDFPAVMDDEPVLICWKEGEERISHYHGWNDGFIGRKPIPGA